MLRYSDGNEESITANIDAWSRSCLRTEDDMFFRRFRSDRAFLDIVEGTPETGAIWNLKRLLKNANFVKALPLIRQSDYVGSPRGQVLFNDPTGTEALCALNPATVRYANNAANCIDFFGPLTGYNIYEIGAGYGGDCKVFNDYSTALYGKSLQWGIFDLPSSYVAIDRFLFQFLYSATKEHLQTFKPKKPYLVISNGALSEMRGSLLSDYLSQVVGPATYGYFITNFDTHSKPFGGYSTDDFLGALKDLGKDARELSADSYLSHFDKQARSRLIVFGTNVPVATDIYNWMDVLHVLAIQKSYGLLRRLTQRFVR